MYCLLLSVNCNLLHILLVCISHVPEQIICCLFYQSFLQLNKRCFFFFNPQRLNECPQLLERVKVQWSLRVFGPPDRTNASSPSDAALVPDSVKKELLQRIRAFLAQHATLWMDHCLDTFCFLLTIQIENSFVSIVSNAQVLLFFLSLSIMCFHIDFSFSCRRGGKIKSCLFLVIGSLDFFFDAAEDLLFNLMSLFTPKIFAVFFFPILICFSTDQVLSNALMNRR